MFKKNRLGKKKILLYYFIAIVVPSIILGVLAFRGVMNDQAISEKENRRLLTETGMEIIAESHLFLTNTEEQFAAKIAETGKPSSGMPFIADSSLTQFQLKNPVIESILHINDSGVIQLLNTGLLYFPDETFSHQYEAPSQTITEILSTGWKYEFREKNLQKALSYYQNQLKNSKNQNTIISVLLALARIQNKLSNHEDAINTYQLIAQQYGRQRMDGGLPLGIAALIETSRIHFTAGDTAGALTTIHHLLTKVSALHWELEISHFNQVISVFREILSGIAPAGNDLNQTLTEKVNLLLEELNTGAEKTNRQLTILRKANIFIKDHGARPPESESEYRIYANVEREPVFVSFFPKDNNRQWLIVFNIPEFLNHLTQISFPAHTEINDFDWQIIKEGRQPVFQSSQNINGDILSTSVFPSWLPSWSILWFKKPAGIISTFVSASHGIFVYIFIFIVVALLLGLYFTLQIINKELVLSKMKSDFISTVTHEFKSPLTSIRQMTEMLHNDRIKSESRKKEYYGVMLEQSERLSHLIDNILDFSSIEEGKKAFRFEKTDPVELVKDARSVFQKSIANEGFTISLAGPEKLPEIVVDREAIQQVIYNLLDNACKYSGKSRKIELLTEHKGDEVIISVQDFGIGIERDDRHKIFDRFYRGGKELTRTIKGSGIGLTIVKRIVEAHSGKISFKSTPGRGSTFYVTLPTVKN